MALNISAYRIKKYIGAYLAAIGKVDALVFTAGVGENSPKVREMAVSGLGHLGIILRGKRNQTDKGTRDIATKDSVIRIFVIPTNEELEIVLQTEKIIKNEGA